MSIIPSLGTATTGINAFQNGLTVISDNIANTDTTAFKENDILFSELISQFTQVGGARYQTGRGALVDIVRAPFKQGALEQTGNNLDLAIEGDGFFMLKDPLEAPIPFFSRAGAFHVDSKGFLANTNGLLLQGSTVTVDPVTGKATAGAAAGAIDLSKVIALPKATTKINATLNLFSGEPDPATNLDGLIPAPPGDIVGGTFSINGVDLGDITAGVDNLITAINAASTTTGVQADEDSLDFLKLTNLNGGPIVISLNSDADPDIFDKTGLQNGSFQSDGGKILTGTVTGSGGAGEAKIAIGEDSKFKTELRAGDIIVLGNKGYIVQSIESDTQLTVTEDIDSDLVGLTAPASVRNATFSSPVTVFDSLGVDHLINVSFIKLAPVVTSVEDPSTGIVTTTSVKNQWGWSAIVGKNDNKNGAFDQVQATGVMTFTSAGLLDPKTPVTSNFTTGGFDFKGGAALNQQIAFNFLGTKADGSDGATQFGTLSASAVIKQTQDGESAGVLQTLSVDSQGVINGLFTNGTTQALAQLLLATFPNNDGLVRVGGNSYIQSKESGDPLLAAAGSGGRGKITSNALEVSNVDLTKQFVKLITYQRGFQANSRVIVTSDEVIQEIVNLKR
jgi:flagellar hook protein FlgE